MKSINLAGTDYLIKDGILVIKDYAIDLHSIQIIYPIEIQKKDWYYLKIATQFQELQIFLGIGNSLPFIKEFHKEFTLAWINLRSPNLAKELEAYNNEPGTD